MHYGEWNLFPYNAYGDGWFSVLCKVCDNSKIPITSVERNSPNDFFLFYKEWFGCINELAVGVLHFIFFVI